MAFFTKRTPTAPHPGMQRFEVPPEVNERLAASQRTRDQQLFDELTAMGYDEAYAERLVRGGPSMVMPPPDAPRFEVFRDPSADRHRDVPPTTPTEGDRPNVA